MENEFRTPVIVGVADVVDRWSTAEAAKEPLSLMVEAAREADVSGLLASIDSVDVVNLTSWRYHNAPAELCAQLGVSARRTNYGPIGGETPVRLIDEAAQRIARGESDVALVCGAEAQYSVGKARSTGQRLDWTPLAPRPEDDGWWDDYLNPLAIDLQVVRPSDVYPLFENAAAAAWGQSPASAAIESAEIWAGMSEVAESRASSWSSRSTSVREIAEPSADNRIIAWPYTKRMVANPAVNQGAAVLLTSLDRARSLGIAEDRLVYIWSGAAANEPRDYLLRSDYAACPAQQAVLRALSERMQGRAFDHQELYSCFPIVPKQARRTLGLPADAPMTVAGGLSFFGAPLNNYMTHATVAMVERLRGRPDSFGLLYGQGEFMTKHHGLILSTVAPTREQYELVRDVGGHTEDGVIPQIDASFIGEAIVETFTVIHDRDGDPKQAVVIARTASGSRTMVAVPTDDGETLARLMSRDVTPVGSAGRIVALNGSPRSWKF